MKDITVIDDFLDDPAEYRKAALGLEFRTYDFPGESFHGISVMPLDSRVPEMLKRAIPAAPPVLSFFRKSPFGQKEPHFIHTDIDMGDWSAILYLNPNPPAEDGTAFWTHDATGSIGSLIRHERSEEGQTDSGWTRREVVQAKFNRLLIFRASLFHSRAIGDNWGEGNDARLTQVTFGRAVKQ